MQRFDKAEIHYITGDATNPQGTGNKIIVHICNDIGAWGAGFVLAVSKKWRAPEIAYRAEKKHTLGTVQLVRVSDDIIVANMVAQHGVGIGADGKPPIRYEAVRACLNQVNDSAYHTGSTIHMPRIGCGLAGGDWSKIEEIIKDVASVPVYVYDLK
jgi:O-acetyl-ADP-ribose deacetylase (regulator of RNase III)